MARAHHEFTAPVSAAWGRRHSWMLRPRPLRQLGWRDSFGSAAGTHSPLLNRIGLQISCARTRTASLVTSMARGRLPFDSDADGRIAVKQKVVALRDERSQPSGGRCDIASLYLKGLEGNWSLRPFRGITTAPILSANGDIRIADGYDEATGLWCHNIPDLELLEQPTKAEAHAALYRLRCFFRTFPFADGAQIQDAELGVAVIDVKKPPGLDESSFLVALLTAVCRQSLELAPAYLVRAPTFSGAGTGKGLAVKSICIVASGVRPSAFTSGHDHEEFDKRLTSALIEARPSVFLDNFNAKELRSDILASVLTESGEAGHTEHFAPVRITATPGRLMRARITGADDAGLLAEAA